VFLAAGFSFDGAFLPLGPILEVFFPMMEVEDLSYKYTKPAERMATKATMIF
jgi:hypothetical protein